MKNLKKGERQFLRKREEMRSGGGEEVRMEEKGRLRCREKKKEKHAASIG